MAANEVHVLFTAGELGGMIGAACAGNLEAEISSVTVDSRQVVPGSLFVALKGERTDGHRFAVQAVKAGASALMVEQSQCEAVLEALHTSLDAESLRRVGLIVVEACLASLQKAAREYRRRMQLYRIGVTGSSGKTTTKECIGAVLSAAYGPEAVAMSQGNLNSDIGMALALFGLRPGHRVGVFEMGINRVGEMDELVAMYEPDAAVITTIGTAHIGMFGSREGIAREKGRIFSAFDGRQHAFIREDDPFRDYLARCVRGQIHYFGLHETPGIESVESLGLHGWHIRWQACDIRFPLPGMHNLFNACAALSVAHELGIEPEAASRGLGQVRPLFGRSEIREGRITVLQDCYNANPESMAAALEFFGTLPAGSRRILVLGSMLELGEEAEKAHREIGLRAFRTAPSAVFLFGQEMKSAFDALRSQGYSGFLMHTGDMDKLITEVSTFIHEGDFMLIKGSRGMALERLAEALEAKGWIAPLSDPAAGGLHAS